MNAARPAYYTSLSAFRALFQQGLPILTYHKLGPRPSGVRLKGLYVSAGLFARQLAELRRGGFISASLDQWQNQCAGGRIGITFDDGYVNVLTYGLESLAASGFRAIQFLPADLLGRTNEWDQLNGEKPESIMDSAQVRDWIAAGHEIGSHTLKHPFLTRISLSEAKEEIAGSRKKLEDLFGRPVDHFCYPYGDWNPAVRDLVRDAGYKTACTTDCGINFAGDDPFALKRYTARYASRNVRTILSWLRNLLRT